MKRGSSDQVGSIGETIATWDRIVPGDNASGASEPKEIAHPAGAI